MRTFDQKEAITAAHQSGLGVSQIAERFSVYRSTVTRTLRGAVIQLNSSALTHDSVEAIHHFYALGNNVAQTARHFAVGKNTQFVVSEPWLECFSAR